MEINNKTIRMNLYPYGYVCDSYTHLTTDDGINYEDTKNEIKDNFKFNVRIYPSPKQKNVYEFVIRSIIFVKKLKNNYSLHKAKATYSIIAFDYITDDFKSLKTELVYQHLCRQTGMIDKKYSYETNIPAMKFIHEYDYQSEEEDFERFFNISTSSSVL